MLSNVIKAKDKWLLTLIRPNPHIKDRTRLQERTNLTQKGILNDSVFIGDLELSRYVISSSQLAINFKKFENKKITMPSTFYSDKDSTRSYYLTDKVTTLINERIENKKDQIAKIEYFTFTDFQKSPKELISDARLKSMDFADKSIIGAMISAVIGVIIGTVIGRGLIMNTSFQNSENNPNGKENNPIKPSISTKEHVFNDEDFRLKLAKSIGYDEIPPPRQYRF